ncbi:ABC transporter substrate-binding protein [Paenibacillus sp. BC26]|uniref:ABC transporter substrate-binding protein n=1 Tax=Paenibacillus sp. BC26 TaxID=1881032 RepID=UPI0008E1D49E|nr:ABC transporter substrate-binding protein [Paenibacillus sp. BC26]SFS51632.1 putative aldouronate transport system substrate-binding protein [Paenibacillus sp. BC26]
MKGRLRRKASLVLSMIAAVVVLLSACTSGSGGSMSSSEGASNRAKNSSSGSAAEVDRAAPGAIELDPYEISIYVPGATTEDIPVVEEAINAYLKDKINATVKLNFIDWNNYQNKTNLMITSGEKFDLFYMANWLGYPDAAVKGMLLPVDDLIEKYGQAIKPNLNMVYQTGAKVNGKLYGVPSNKEYASNQALLIRKDIMDKYGFNANEIQTYHDFGRWFKIIKENERELVPFAGINDMEWAILSKFEPIGNYFGVLDKEANDLKVIDMFQSPKYLEIVKQAREWYTAGYIVKDAATTQVTREELMKNGKVATMMNGAKPGIDKEKTIMTGRDLVQIDFSKPYTSTGDVTGALLTIPNTSADPERVMMFLNLLYSDKYLLNLIDWGVEGKHYVKVSDNVIDFPQGVDATTVGYSAQGDQWIFGNQFNSYLFKSEDPDKWKKLISFNESAIISKALGFSFDPTPVQNEISACLTTMNQYFIGLSSGSLDPDKYVPELVKKLKANGLDKIIAEKQRQLNVWVAHGK